MDTIECACGCGTEISPVGKNGKPRKFLKGHATKNRNFKKVGSEEWWEKRLERINSKPGLCKCGCGTPVVVDMKWLKANSGPTGKTVYKPRFAQGHMPQIECACGCGTLINKYGKKNRLNKCVPSHGGRLATPVTITEEEWVRRTEEYNASAPQCACGCGQYLTRTVSSMKSRNQNIPKYATGHNSRTHLVHRFTPLENSIIYGSLLGDMSITIPTTGNPRLAFTHGRPQKEYAIHKTESLKRLGAKFREIKSAGYGEVSIVMRTSCMPILMEVWNKVRPNGKKEVNEEWLKEIDEVALAYWFMDDGSLSRTKGGEPSNCSIHTCGFSEKENELLSSFLSQRFGLKAIISHSKGYPYLRFNVKDTKRLVSIISPHLHPSMAYKGNYDSSGKEI